MFDIREYKIQLALEAKKSDQSEIDKKRLKQLCVVSLSFVKDAVEDINTPCWISIVVLPALRLDNPKSKFRCVAFSKGYQKTQNNYNNNPTKTSIFQETLQAYKSLNLHSYRVYHSKFIFFF